LRHQETSQRREGSLSACYDGFIEVNGLQEGENNGVPISEKRGGNVAFITATRNIGVITVTSVTRTNGVIAVTSVTRDINFIAATRDVNFITATSNIRILLVTSSVAILVIGNVAILFIGGVILRGVTLWTEDARRVHLFFQPLIHAIMHVPQPLHG
jgi:hypothetical protein